MQYDFIAVPDAEIPQAVDPVFQHVVTTYASEANKTVSMWRAVPDDLLDFKPHEKTNPIRTILVHQLLSERRFFGQFGGTHEPSVDELLPSGEKPTVQAYIDKYLWLVKVGSPSLLLERLRGGWSSATSSAACNGSGFGSSGGGCCTPAITGPRCRLGFGWRGNTSRLSTGLPAT